ncbi:MULTISPECIES: hypothetical protein [unclassified Phyllobacterium]|jgi:hypothetical protein|uniref:hypothetical protein n=1 Tax=unclassified Phyllobacterium TaxID=2638441 RepID=UPI00208DE1CB|nr:MULTISPECIES: hypothetical protein [unclassified Phyllobacterium]
MAPPAFSNFRRPIFGIPFIGFPFNRIKNEKTPLNRASPVDPATLDLATSVSHCASLDALGSSPLTIRN